MAQYRVAFDGKWAGRFDDRRQAMDWAQAVGQTGRVAFVVRWRKVRGAELLAIFPEEREAHGRIVWREYRNSQ